MRTRAQLKRHLEKAQKEKELKNVRDKLKARGKISAVLSLFKRRPEDPHIPLILGVQINETVLVHYP